MKALVIAEAGVNHNGDSTLAFRLVEAAKEAGADAVKFQLFDATSLVNRKAPKAAYQLQTTDGAESQFEMLRRLELGSDIFYALARHCAELSLKFIVTPFDLPSVSFLAGMGLETFKIPSGEITNLPYLRAIGALSREIILSTGMSTLDEVRAALDVLDLSGTPPEHVTLLHCTTEYPAPFSEVNLRAMKTMYDAFPRIKGIGYSDHTTGIAVAVAAAALGATVIEKHFTLDKTMEGPDHKASLEPDELALMIRSIREVEVALGDGVKTPRASELKNRDVVRKSIVAAKSIHAGETFSAENITTKRPGTGLSPMLWDLRIGKKAVRAYRADEEID